MTRALSWLTCDTFRVLDPIDHPIVAGRSESRAMQIPRSSGPLIDIDFPAHLDHNGILAQDLTLDAL